MSKLTADMPCPKCEVEYGVMPQTYMLTRGGFQGRKSSFWPVSVLTTLIGGSCMVAISCVVRARASGDGAARPEGRAPLATGAALAVHGVDSIVATASAAIPSPRPTKPIRSL